MDSFLTLRLLRDSEMYTNIPTFSYPIYLAAVNEYS